MVQGNALDALSSSSPEATNSCGTFFSLRYLRGEIAGRAERAEHQQHVVLLDKIARQLQRGPRIGIVVVRNEADLAAVDAAALVDHVEIGGLGLADRAERRERPDTA